MTDSTTDLLDFLTGFLTPRRLERFHQVLEKRTRWITLVLSDLYQQHNASAILRTCDAFGVQDVHIAEQDHLFETNPEIALGTDQWLTLSQRSGPGSLEETITALRQRGYRIAATVLHAESRPVDELDLDQPVALMFGTEKDGLSSEAVELADVRVHLPMYGFVESFNVSVAAALCLQQLIPRLHRTAHPWQLSAEERRELLLRWTRQSVPGAEALERRFAAQKRQA